MIRFKLSKNNPLVQSKHNVKATPETHIWKERGWMSTSIANSPEGLRDMILDGENTVKQRS